MKINEQAGLNPKIFVPSQTFSKQTSNMQTFFSSKTPQNTIEKPRGEGEVVAIKDETKPEEIQEQSTRTIKRKSIHAMTKEEKIDYLLNKPKYIPNIPCLFLTKSDTVIGYIVDRIDRLVMIDLTTNFEKVTINIDDILEIHPYVTKNK